MMTKKEVADLFYSPLLQFEIDKHMSYFNVKGDLIHIPEGIEELEDFYHYLDCYLNMIEQVQEDNEIFEHVEDIAEPMVSSVYFLSSQYNVVYGDIELPF